MANFSLLNRSSHIHSFKINADQLPLAQFVIRQSSDDCLNEVRRTALESYLPTISSDVSFTGYEEGGREKVWHQVNAVYNALLNKRLHYSLEPGHVYTSPMSQSLRAVADVLNYSEATCIDIVNLMAALLLQIGLNPIVVIVGDRTDNVATHAVLGFWLEDQLAKNVKITAVEVTGNLASIAICEATGVLRQPTLTFSNACTSTSQYFPNVGNDRLPRPPGSDVPESLPFTVPPHIGILYAVDIRRAMEVYAARVPVIAMMGAKGGVGKTLLCARTAEMIAETGKNVLLLDFDIENCGSTVFHPARLPYGLPAVHTIYDHLVPHSSGLQTSRTSEDQNLSLWNITPPYLVQSGLGRIHMIPARAEGDINAFALIANIDPKNRNKILLSVTDEIIERAGLAEDIECVIIDCGAGTNPLYSAAMNRANYGIVVATPEDVCITQWNSIRAQLRADFPQIELQHVVLYLNMIENPLDVLKWRAYRPVGIVRKDPKLRTDYYRNAVYFDLGYDSFSSDVREALSSTMLQAHQELLPSEYDVWMAPWGDVLREGWPSRVLANPMFRRICHVTAVLPYVLLFVLFILSYYLWSSFQRNRHPNESVSVTLTGGSPDLESLKESLRSRLSFGPGVNTFNVTGEFSEDEIGAISMTLKSEADRRMLQRMTQESSLSVTLKRFVLALLVVTLAAGVGGTLYHWNLFARRKRLLSDLQKLDPDDSVAVYRYLKPILCPIPAPGEEIAITPESFFKKAALWLKPDKLTMRWLADVLDRQIEESRQRIRLQRVEAQVAKHI